MDSEGAVPCRSSSKTSVGGKKIPNGEVRTPRKLRATSEKEEGWTKSG